MAVAVITARATADAERQRSSRLSRQLHPLVLAVLLLPALGLPAACAAAEPDTAQVLVTFPGRDVTLTAELATTRVARQRGLSGRQELAEDAGMLFVLEQEGLQGIWMKDMRFPLDVLWFSSDYRLVGMAGNVSPGSHPEIFRPAQPARYILEVNAGFLARHPLVHGERIIIDSATAPAGNPAGPAPRREIP